MHHLKQVTLEASHVQSRINIKQAKDQSSSHRQCQTNGHSTDSEQLQFVTWLQQNVVVAQL